MSRADEIGSDRTEVLVRTAGWSISEETTVWFALPATHQGGAVYRLEPPTDDDEARSWEFAPGEIVRCERRRIEDRAIGCWDDCLVAVARAH